MIHLALPYMHHIYTVTWKCRPICITVWHLKYQYATYYSTYNGEFTQFHWSKISLPHLPTRVLIVENDILSTSKAMGLIVHVCIAVVTLHFVHWDDHRDIVIALPSHRDMLLSHHCLFDPVYHVSISHCFAHFQRVQSKKGDICTQLKI